MGRRPKTEATEVRKDGLVNLITGLGLAGRDKSVANKFDGSLMLGPDTAEAIYRGNGIGRRIIELPILEMTREWFDVDGDSDDAATGYLESLHAKMAITEALTWGDLYGGSLVVLGLSDGVEDPAEPLNEANLGGIEYFHVYDRWQVTWASTDLYDDPTDPKFGQPQLYNITPYNISARGQGMFQVHETRTLKFIGTQLPPRAQREQRGWGDSVLQASYEQLRNVVSSLSHCANLIEEWTIGVMTIKNLVQMLGAKGGEDKVRKRLEIIDLGKSVLRSMLLAEGETFEKKTQAVSGLSDILDREAQALSAATGIPLSLLFGERQSGGLLKSTGKSDRENWFDHVRGLQERKLQPQLERLVRYVFISKDGPTNGVEPKNWKIAFRPLWQPTEAEEATMRYQVAQTDQIYIDKSVLLPEEVALSRFGGDRYSTETQINVALHQEPTPEEIAAKEAAAQAGIAALAKAAPKNGGAPPADPGQPVGTA